MQRGLNMSGILPNETVKLKGLSYCYEEALNIIKKDYPEADMDIFTGSYSHGYWNDAEMYIDEKASYEYPGAYYPGPAASSDEAMIEILVSEGLRNINNNQQ